MAEKYNIAGNFGKGAKEASPILVGAIIAKAGEKLESEAMRAAGALIFCGGTLFCGYKNIRFIMQEEKYPNQTEDLKQTESKIKRCFKRIIPYVSYIAGAKVVAIPAFGIFESLPEEPEEGCC